MLVYVNWASVLKDQPIDPVFANLCSCDPKYLEGIFSIKRYRKYFTLDYPERIPELGLLIKRLSKADDVRQELGDFLIECPVPYFLIQFEGYYGGTCGGVPVWSDKKNKKFYQTSKKERDSIQYRDINWIVLYSRMIDDKVIKPHVRYTFIMAPFAVFQFQSTYPSCFEFEGELSEEEFAETMQ